MPLLAIAVPVRQPPATLRLHLSALAKLYLEKDCSLAEINPWVRTGDGKMIAPGFIGLGSPLQK